MDFLKETMLEALFFLCLKPMTPPGIFSSFSSVEAFIPTDKTVWVYLFQEQGVFEALPRPDSPTLLQLCHLKGNIVGLRLKPAEISLDRNKQVPLKIFEGWEGLV